MKNKGFTLIELLVTIAIIGILVTISSFALTNAQKSGRDAKRKADLENIAVALELYRSDCNRYPVTGTFSFGGNLIGSGTPTTCSASNVYMRNVPQDGGPGTKTYSYVGVTANQYRLCASLEEAPSPAIPAASLAGCSCGSGFSCNWAINRP